MSLTYISSNTSLERSPHSTPVASLSSQISAMTSSAGITAVSSNETVSDRVLLQKKTVEEVPYLKKYAGEEKKDSVQKSMRGVGEILFAYNFRGDLRIQFTDTRKNLVYQTPPQLFARITDIISDTKSAVDTKA